MNMQCFKAGATSVSVVIPLYNHEKYISDAVSSVLMQGDVVGELIVIDDGSSDRSATIMADLARTDPRILFWSQPNQGAHATINTGLSHATGAYLTILNSDDTYLPHRLTRLVQSLEIDSGADLAASALRFIDGDGTEIDYPWHTKVLDVYRSTHDLGYSLVNGNFIMTTSNMLFRRHLIDKIGMFTSLRYAHDLDFALRAVAFGTRLTFIDEPLMCYRLHGSNTIREDHTRVRFEWALATAHFVHLAWERSMPESRPRDNDRLQRLLDIVEHHGLGRAVQLSLKYLRRQSTSSLIDHSILTDLEFHQVLMAYL